MKVAVGTENPVKIEAVKNAFLSIWPNENWEIVELKVSSGVSDQPMTDEETIIGARNRANTAISKLKADYGVGIEGGLQKYEDHWLTCGWMVVVDKLGNEGLGSSIKMVVPNKMMNLINNGTELGKACDIVFEKHNSKQLNGFFGLMTNDTLTRTSGYVDGLISALSNFIHPELFKNE